MDVHLNPRLVEDIVELKIPWRLQFGDWEKLDEWKEYEYSTKMYPGAGDCFWEKNKSWYSNFGILCVKYKLRYLLKL